MFDFLSHWIVQIFIVIFFTLILDFVQKLILKRVHRKLKNANGPWGDALLDALGTPLSIFIWIMGVSFSTQIIQDETRAAIFSAVTPLRYVGVIVVVSWFAIRFVKRVEENILVAAEKKGKAVDPTTAGAVSKILRGSVLITAGLVALQSLGVKISGVMTFGGIGGIAIGFAAKDLLANFFGAFMLYMDRPFSVGDWIRSPDREIEGTVETIGWRLTCIRTFDKRPLYVPNSLFTTISIENPSRMSNRRIQETIGVRYKDAELIIPILKEIRQMLQAHPEIDTKQTLMVNLDHFGPSSLDFFIYTFTKTTVWTRFHEIKEDVLLKIHDIICAHGGEVAFPTTTIHVTDQSILEGPESNLVTVE